MCIRDRITPQRMNPGTQVMYRAQNGHLPTRRGQVGKSHNITTLLPQRGAISTSMSKSFKPAPTW
eukprot:7932601-Prorocentrum_lima.AAC.1